MRTSFLKSVFSSRRKNVPGHSNHSGPSLATESGEVQYARLQRPSTAISPEAPHSSLHHSQSNGRHLVRPSKPGSARKSRFNRLKTMPSTLSLNTSEKLESKKLVSPAEELKMSFLKNLELGAHVFENTKYQMVFLGSHAFDVVINLLGLQDRKIAASIIRKLDHLGLYEHVVGKSGRRCKGLGIADSDEELYTLTRQAFRCLLPYSPATDLPATPTTDLPIEKGSGEHLARHESQPDIEKRHRTTDSTSSRSNIERPTNPVFKFPGYDIDPSITSESIDIDSDTPNSACTLDSLETVEIPSCQFNDVFESWTSEKNAQSSLDIFARLSDNSSSTTSFSKMGEQKDKANGYSSCSYLVYGSKFDSGIAQDTSCKDSGAIVSKDCSPAMVSNRDAAFIEDYDYKITDHSSQHSGQSKTTEPTTSALVARTVEIRKVGTAPAGSIGDSTPDYTCQPPQNSQRRPSSGITGGVLESVPIRSRVAKRSESLLNLLRPKSMAEGLRREFISNRPESMVVSLGTGKPTEERPQSEVSNWSTSANTYTPSLRVAGTSTSTKHNHIPSTPMTTSTTCGTASPSYHMVGLAQDPRLSTASNTLYSPSTASIPGNHSSEWVYGDSVSTKASRSGHHVYEGDCQSLGYSGVVSRALLWKHTVPKSLLETLSADTVALQEIIYETIGTERDYIHDMEVIDTIFTDPLRRSGSQIVPQNTVDDLIYKLFYNYRAVLEINKQLCDKLCALQRSESIVSGIGEAFLEWSENLEPLVDYSVHVPVAQVDLEQELARNPVFSNFTRMAEQHPDARRLPIQSFIGRPAARLAKYPLLLPTILKHTPKDSPDYTILPIVIERIKTALDRIDRLSGEQADELRMRKLRMQLKPSREVSLDALDIDNPGRRVVHEGLLYRSDGQRIMAFLLDNALVLAAEHKSVHAKGVAEYTIEREPIPIYLLDVSLPNELSAHNGLSGSTAATMGRRMLARAGLRKGQGHASIDAIPSSCVPLLIHRLGPDGFVAHMWAGNAQEQQQWKDIARSRIFSAGLSELGNQIVGYGISETDFRKTCKPLCSTTYQSPSTGFQMIMIGAEDGLYMGLSHKSTSIRRISTMPMVTSVHVFEEYDMVVVLENHMLVAYSLGDVEDPNNWGRDISGTTLAHSVSYIAVGRYRGRPLLVYARVRSSLSTFSCIQPYDAKAMAAAGPTEFKKGRTVFRNGKYRLHIVQEFVIGNESYGMQFFRKKLCVICKESFEIVDIRRGYEHVGLPSPLDPDLLFVQQEKSGRPLAIHKIDNEFLLCYQEFAFYLEKSGKRTRPELLIRWLVPPTQVIVSAPYIIAFNPIFIEVRHSKTGNLEHTIRLPNGVCLNPGSVQNGIHISAPPESTTYVNKIIELEAFSQAKCTTPVSHLSKSPSLKQSNRLGSSRSSTSIHTSSSTSPSPHIPLRPTQQFHTIFELHFP
ncbi:RHO1 GDP-GTP exchange protein 2 [Mycoemilia scoparia]|uniref:RHO1 GDP-GTP exchange protein 2 n=1 Tax=Mycoemilia scoparia TaxID=417184 RepID=A0A9W8DL72_9FUNG|nr:RHO1 GDP-GTP exchange protein 2 [Mycoemilia scoparia]